MFATLILFLWTLVVTAGLVFLYQRYCAMQTLLEDERRSRDASAQQQRDTLAALRTTETRDSMVLENIDEIIFRLKTVNDSWVVESMSSRVTDLLGYTPEEAIALGNQIVHPHDVENVARQTSEAFRSAATITFQYRMKHR